MAERMGLDNIAKNILEFQQYIKYILFKYCLTTENYLISLPPHQLYWA